MPDVQFLTQHKCFVVLATLAAGTDDTVYSEKVTMDGFAGVVFLGRVGAIVDGGSAIFKLQTSSNGTDFTDVDDMAQAVQQDSLADPDPIDDSGTALMLDAPGTYGRYLRVALVRADENVSMNDVWAIQYGATNRPVYQPSSTTWSGGDNGGAGYTQPPIIGTQNGSGSPQEYAEV